MEFFKDIFIHSYIGAAIWILIGIWFLKSWNKKKLKASVYSDSQRLLGNLYGFAAGVGAIILGVAIIISKILGKL